LEKASFLTTDEKRAAIGYGPMPVDNTNAQKIFNPFQPRDDRGRWTNSDGTDVQQVADRSGYPVDILEEEAKGGHTFERHINKPDEYLKARVTGSRTNIAGIVTVGEKRAGSFTSVEAANKLVNSTISQNQTSVDAFVKGSFPNNLPYKFVHAEFSSPTGYEAYARDHRSSPVMRDAYGVTVLLRRATGGRGYYVHSAWPRNND
jgi:Bacterial CdiA-CT RNAse A domain